MLTCSGLASSSTDWKKSAASSLPAVLVQHSLFVMIPWFSFINLINFKLHKFHRINAINFLVKLWIAFQSDIMAADKINPN